ncbi:MAG: hypothetical protein ACKN9E_14460 [Microcystaceae cyanobacterium]
MSQRDNFAGGFLLGTLIGGTVGGIIGVLLANRQTAVSTAPRPNQTPDDPLPHLDSEVNIELARRRLEEKIAQLNGAIDDVRHQLGNVNSLAVEVTEEISP